MSVVGVDFGNQNCLIAAAGRGGVDVILNGNSNRQNPCMVGFGTSRQMGEAAATSRNSNFKNTIYGMKRLVGLPFDSVQARREMQGLPYTCVPIPHDGSPASVGVKVECGDETKTIPVECVLGMLVKHLGGISAAKAAAASSSDGKKTNSSAHFPQDWVVAVPCWYTDAQKRAVLNGCESVGISGVARLMHETTATALAYGIFKDIRKEFTKDNPSHVMFLDFGQSGYSICIVSFEPGKLTVKSTQFDKHLGGRDIDESIANWFAQKFEEKYKNRLSGKPMDRPKTKIKILAAAEKAKKTLSPTGVKEVRINLECLMDDLDFGVTLQSTEYEKMLAPVLERLEAPISRALNEAGLTAKDLSSVEIVGGSTRIACVKKRLSQLLHLDPNLTNFGLSTTMNADEAVARGAALQSAILSPRFKVLPYDIVEFQPYPIKIAWDGEANAQPSEGVEVEGGMENDASLPSTNSVVMFERGSNFPVVRRVVLRRAGEFLVTASYGDSARSHLPEGSMMEIASFKIQAAVGSEHKIRVNVKQDVHGVIALSSAQMVEEYYEEETIPASEPKDDKKTDATSKTPADDASKSKKEDKVTPPAEPVKKKKIKKTNLQFSMSRPIEWTSAERNKAYEQEVAMENADRIVKETADMRNELESYIYDMRDRIVSENHLLNYSSSDEREAFSKALEDTENWLYEDGFDAVKSVYGEKLSSLKATGDPIELRHSEAAARNAAISKLRQTIDSSKTWLQNAQSDELYDHITETEFSDAHSKCDAAASWMYDALDKQGAKELTEDPAFLVSQVKEKTEELARFIHPVKTKPRPKPKVEKKEEVKEDKKEDGAAASTPEPMDTDKTDEGKPSTEPMDTSK